MILIFGIVDNTTKYQYFQVIFYSWSEVYWIMIHLMTLCVRLKVFEESDQIIIENAININK